MKRVYRSESLVDVVHWKNVLEQRGIGCELRRAHLWSIIGELPWLEALPELWVLDERDEALAKKIISDLRSGRAAEGSPWRCGRCSEMLEPQFTACWRCGHERSHMADGAATARVGAEPGR